MQRVRVMRSYCLRYSYYNIYIRLYNIRSPHCESVARPDRSFARLTARVFVFYATMRATEGF